MASERKVPQGAVADAAVMAAIRVNGQSVNNQTTRSITRRALEAAYPAIRLQVLEEVREALEKLPTFEPEHDESNSRPFLLGNDPILMAEEEYPDTMGPAEWLRRSDVLAAVSLSEEAKR